MYEELLLQWDQYIKRIKDITKKDMREAVLNYVQKYKEELIIAPGSIMHHHNYDGGLIEHVNEVIDIGKELFYFLHNEYQQDLDLDEVIFCGSIHDIGKKNQYIKNPDDKWEYKKDAMQHSLWLIIDWNLMTDYKLNPRVAEALLAHHGGWARTEAKINHALGAVIHAADLISSRLQKNSLKIVEDNKSLLDILHYVTKDIPAEEWDKFPKNLSTMAGNLEHYTAICPGCGDGLFTKDIYSKENVYHCMGCDIYYKLIEVKGDQST